VAELSKDARAHVGAERAPVSIAWSDSATTTLAYGRFPEWAALAGVEVELGGRVMNTNGAGLGGATDWTARLKLMDFGPSRSGALDFSQGAVTDLVLWGGAQALEGDSACATDDVPDARNCVRLLAGSGMALRFAGPLVGLRIDARAQPSSGPSPGTLPSATLLAADGSAPSPATNQFEAPVEDVFALLQVPSSFNTQLDPACATPVSAVVLVDAIEPLP
jgi:hypothetical protein